MSTKVQLVRLFIHSQVPISSFVFRLPKSSDLLSLREREHKEIRTSIGTFYLFSLPAGTEILFYGGSLTLYANHVYAIIPDKFSICSIVLIKSFPGFKIVCVRPDCPSGFICTMAGRVMLSLNGGLKDVTPRRAPTAEDIKRFATENPSEFARVLMGIPIKGEIAGTLRKLAKHFIDYETFRALALEKREWLIKVLSELLLQRQTHLL